MVRWSSPGPEFALIALWLSMQRASLPGADGAAFTPSAGPASSLWAQPRPPWTSWVSRRFVRQGIVTEHVQRCRGGQHCTDRVFDQSAIMGLSCTTTGVVSEWRSFTIARASIESRAPAFGPASNGLRLRVCLDLDFTKFPDALEFRGELSQIARAHQIAR
jgi:hypothetical protein